MSKVLRRRLYDVYFGPFWIILSFVFWVFALRGFLSLKLLPCGDAIPYLEHTKFFIENMARGKLPLWDPFWSHGVPNDLFLRRIGIFNPFYSIILLLESLGLPYALASVWFWIGYYWSGMIAFYLLSLRLYNNRLIAYAGYLILLFSTSTLRLFSSYEMLITIPIIWFFYFLVAFSQTPRKLFFLGTVLFFMILISTYIPFYFLTFFILFLALFLLFYRRQIPEVIQKHLNFFKINKILVIVSLGVVLFSFVPGIILLDNSVKSQIVLPQRHGDASSKLALSVPLNNVQWGIVEELLTSCFFPDLQPKGAINVYVPLFACIVFALGLFCRISRLAVFMLVCALALVSIFLPCGPPFYNFLYHHIFFFKTFRNFHFFIWIVLVPLFTLFVLEHWRMFESSLWKDPRRNKYFLFYALTVHILAFIYLRAIGEDRLGAYLMLIFSGFFWSLMILGKLTNDTWKFALLSLAIMVQPMEIYYSMFSFSNRPVCQPAGTYDIAFDKLKLEDPASDKGPLYYATYGYNALYENISNNALNSYLKNKFIFVDHLLPINRNQINFTLLEKHFLQDDNLAFVFKDGRDILKTTSSDPSPALHMQRISKEYAGFKVLSFDANDLKVAVDIPFEKFLIYNDSYDACWKAQVNGRAAHIYQTNVAFKGIWVPSGKSIIEFHYGYWWQYAMNIFLWTASLILLFGIIWFGLRDSQA